MNLETDNPDKGQLLKKSAHHREQLEEEVKLITERSDKVITNALIIGGALALTYFLVSSVSDSSGKERERPGRRKIKLVEAKGSDAIAEAPAPVEQAGIVSQIGAVLVAQATGFLLSIAREKLAEFIQYHAVKKEQTNEHP